MAWSFAPAPSASFWIRSGSTFPDAINISTYVVVSDTSASYIEGLMIWPVPSPPGIDSSVDRPLIWRAAGESPIVCSIPPGFPLASHFFPMLVGEEGALVTEDLPPIVMPRDALAADD